MNWCVGASIRALDDPEAVVSDVVEVASADIGEHRRVTGNIDAHRCQ